MSENASGGPQQMKPVQAVLFDLDGTLIDSAPDLAGAANELRQARGLLPLPLAQYRPLVGAGARGMVQVALSLTPQEAAFDAARDEFLHFYQARLSLETHVFPLMIPVLKTLTSNGTLWGIVTNKAHRFTQAVVRSLPDLAAAAVVISGDTTAYAKPHPAPLLEAATRIQLAPEQCCYVGDDLRDIQAGLAAGMQTVAVAWGYLGQGDHITTWGADAVIDQPNQLLKLLSMV
jgi:N-acetyl-D-muramate 6-phosphate phosphatase